MSNAEASDRMHPNLIVCPNKALKGLFTKIRDKDTSSADFACTSKRIMTLLVEESLAELPTTNITVHTPCGPCEGVRCTLTDFATDLCAVSIVRSGDALVDTVRSIDPSIPVGKILIQRDEDDPGKKAKLYYSKMPPGMAQRHVLLCDPMLATGGSAKLAIRTLVDKYQVKTSQIVFANVICAPEGLEALAEEFPDVKIVTACVDSHLNEAKYIVPGLGDYGDRFYNT
mmetsp:Transcript_5324/g.14391  ORF Transcript_5324/g.14391 Transcript_5324/m.14391 type:complete len:228 (+) Transcript_5324:245-928(+)